MKKLFIPIIRSKKLAQLKVIKSLEMFKNYNSVKDLIIPYLEIKYDISEKVKIDFLTQLKNKTHFEELMKATDESIDNYITRITHSSYGESSIPSLAITFNDIITNISLIKSSIELFHKQNKQIALRISNYGNLHKILDVLSLLNKNDYLILDTTDQNIFSLIYGSKINEIIKNMHAKLIYFSNERRQPNLGRSYETDKYTENCNYQLIDLIKAKNLFYDGFGSYCGAKNDDNETAYGTKTYAVFFEYSFKKNKFMVFKSEETDYVATIYTKLTEKLKNYYKLGKLENLDDINGYSTTLLNNIFSKTKNSTASDYIQLTITLYIEQIINYFLLVTEYD